MKFEEQGGGSDRGSLRGLWNRHSCQSRSREAELAELETYTPVHHLWMPIWAFSWGIHYTLFYGSNTEHLLLCIANCEESGAAHCYRRRWSWKEGGGKRESENEKEKKKGGYILKWSFHLMKMISEKIRRYRKCLMVNSSHYWACVQCCQRRPFLFLCLMMWSCSTFSSSARSII